MTNESITALPRSLKGSLDPRKVRDGVPRGKHGAWQRRIRPSVFGEPAFEIELVPVHVCTARPHIWAYDAWKIMRDTAVRDGVNPEYLSIHSAYRSVALQKQIFDYRLNERREKRRLRGQSELPDSELRRLQQKWTALPGRSAHHTGFALDLSLYTLGVREGRRTETWDWLMRRAREFGYFPYLEEPWHWEFNPPGLVECLRDLRNALQNGLPHRHLLSRGPLKL